jgi:hypothetical protein
MNYKIDVNQKNLDRVIHWITVADSKAAGLLAIWTITATGFGVTFVNIMNEIPCPLTWMALISIIFAIAYVLTALISLVRILKIIIPRNRDLGGLKSPFYGECISNWEEEDFVKTMLEMEEITIIEHLSRQTKRMQTVCTRKYDDIKKALMPLYVTIVLMFLYMLFSGFAV